MLELVSPELVGLSPGRLAAIAPRLNRYVDDGKLPGYLMLISRRGRPAYLQCYGWRNVQRQLPVQADTIFRFYSMTKPITAVALLTLYEQGCFQLNDPVSRYIPQFKDMQVFAGGDSDNYHTEPAQREVTIRDLFTHTAGLTYGLFDGHPIDALYQRHDVMGGTLDDLIDRATALPLVFSPGTRWNYSVATDVLGYLIQEFSGLPLDQFFARTIFEPLAMTDTAFWVPADKADRFAACYHYHQREDGQDGMKESAPAFSDAFFDRPALLSGGGGLVSTAPDYLRFMQMMLNRGELDGQRILGRKTIELMTVNHLPGNTDLSGMGMPVFSETPYDGIGFGLGVSVVLSPANSQILGSVGEYAWGGLASTGFWIDPAEDLSVVFLTQLVPSSTYQIRREIRVLTYQAIVD